MKHLVIIGARGWGREIYAAVRNTKAYQEHEYDVKGFLDDKADALEGLKGDFPPILGSVESYEVQPDDVFFCAMGDSQWRKHYAEMISSKGGHFITIINPMARINPTATIGEGTYIGPYTLVSDNVVIVFRILVKQSNKIICYFFRHIMLFQIVPIGSFHILKGLI